MTNIYKMKWKVEKCCCDKNCGFSLVKASGNTDVIRFPDIMTKKFRYFVRLHNASLKGEKK